MTGHRQRSCPFLFTGDFKVTLKWSVDFEQLCLISEKKLKVSASGDSRSEMTCPKAELPSQIPCGCKSAPSPWSHQSYFGSQPMLPAIIPGSEQHWNKFRCNCFSHKKTSKTVRKGSLLSEDKSRSHCFLFLEGKQSGDAEAAREECNKTSK